MQRAYYVFGAIVCLVFIYSVQQGGKFLDVGTVTPVRQAGVYHK